MSGDASSQLTAAFAVAARRFGIAVDSMERDDLLDVVSGPLEDFVTHPNWPTGVVNFSSPLQVSLESSSDSDVRLRILLDVTDHRMGFVSNWATYLATAQRLGRLSDSGYLRLWQRLSESLDGIAPLYRSRVLFGVSFAPGESSSLLMFISTRWMSYDRVRQSFFGLLDSAQQDALDGLREDVQSVNYVSFEFSRNEVSPPTLNLALVPMTRTRLGCLLHTVPGLLAADAVVDVLWRDNWDESREFSTIVQLEPGSDGVALSSCALQLDCQLWGLNSVSRLASVLALIGSQATHAPDRLYTLLQTFAEFEYPLTPSVLAIKGSTLADACVRFDLYPAKLSEVSGTPVRTGADEVDWKFSLDPVIKRATDFLQGSCSDGGYWQDFNVGGVQYSDLEAFHQGRSDEFVTSCVLSVLVKVVEHADLRMPTQWLAERRREGLGWGWNAKSGATCEATCAALLALSAMGEALPPDLEDMLGRYRMESGGYALTPSLDVDRDGGLGASCVSGLALSVLASVRPAPADMIVETIRVLLSQRRGDRGWNSFWWQDDLVATYRVLLGMKSALPALAGDLTVRRDVEWTLANSWPTIQARAVGNNPYGLGLWLSCWDLGGGSWRHSSVRRIVTYLRNSQLEDGRWLSSPTRRLSAAVHLRPWARPDSGQMYIDQNCILTTATVLQGLLHARDGMRLRLRSEGPDVT
jgi:hypothetical protein